MTLLKKIGVHFFIRTTRKNKDGLVPIYMRLIANKRRLIISTNRKVPSKKWNSKVEKVVGNDADSQATNQYLQLIKTRVYDIINLHAIQKKPYSLNMIKGLVFEQNTYIEKKSLLEVAKLHNEEMKTLLNIKYCYKTYQYYTTTTGFLKLFLKEIYKRNDILLDEIDMTFAKKFESWVLLNTKSTNNGTMKHIQRLKKIISWSMKEGWLNINPIQTFAVSFNKFDRGFLTEEEISLLETALLSNKTLISVREQFVFQIYTGISHSDLASLAWKHIMLNHEDNCKPP